MLSRFSSIFWETISKMRRALDLEDARFLPADAAYHELDRLHADTMTGGHP